MVTSNWRASVKDRNMITSIRDTAYGLEHGVKVAEIRKHITMNNRGKFYWTKAQADRIINIAKQIVKNKWEYR